jgi:hypothetical protein
VQGEALEFAVARSVDDLGSVANVDVELPVDLLDEVARHRFGECRASHEDRHLTCVRGQVDGGLPGRVAGPHDEDRPSGEPLRLRGGPMARTTAPVAISAQLDVLR